MTPRTNLDAKLFALNALDRVGKERLLADLAELLTRHGHDGAFPEYSFHDAKIAALPIRLPETAVRRIAAQVAQILRDAGEPADLRATAAFVLGKTYVGEALAAIMATLAEPDPLPAEVARQCAFALDPLVEARGAEGPDLDALGGHCTRHGIPWDAHNRRVLVNDL